MLVPTYIVANVGTNIYWCQIWYQHILVPRLVPTYVRANVVTNTMLVPTQRAHQHSLGTNIVDTKQCCYQRIVGTNTMLLQTQGLYQHNVGTKTMFVPIYVGTNICR